MTIFRLPKTIFDFGAVARLQEELTLLGARRPLIVADKGVVAAGIVARVTEKLNVPPAMFGSVTENPTFADADAANALYREQRCDAIVAVGGGSVIDTAKFAAVLATHGGKTADYAGFPEKVAAAPAPLIVIPTTAGTGSESSPDAGIHPDAVTASTGIGSWRIMPAVAILDPELTLSLPPRLTAATGIDALSHCIEGYLSKTVSPFADAIAIDGIARVTRYLARAVANGQDRDARWNMMAAAYAGGAAIAKGLGPAHAIAITCSDRGLHHGMLSGLGLIATLDLTAPHAPDKMRAIQQAMGLAPGVGAAEGVANFCRSLDLQVSLAALGYKARDVDALGRAAQASHFNFTAPYHPTAQEFSAAIAVLLRT